MSKKKLKISFTYQNYDLVKYPYDIKHYINEGFHDKMIKKEEELSIECIMDYKDIESVTDASIFLQEKCYSKLYADASKLYTVDDIDLIKFYPISFKKIVKKEECIFTAIRFYEILYKKEKK